MPTTRPPMRTFIATVDNGLGAPRERRIEAAYYRADGVFTTFKDSDNKQVFTARNDILLSVERVPETHGVCGVAECTACPSGGFRSIDDVRDRLGEAE